MSRIVAAFEHFRRAALRSAPGSSRSVHASLKAVHEQLGCGFGWLFGGLCLDRALEFFMRTLS
jgi:hypothetical protein